MTNKDEATDFTHTTQLFLERVFFQPLYNLFLLNFSLLFPRISLENFHTRKIFTSIRDSFSEFCYLAESLHWWSLFSVNRNLEAGRDHWWKILSLGENHKHDFFHVSLFRVSISLGGFSFYILYPLHTVTHRMDQNLR